MNEVENLSKDKKTCRKQYSAAKQLYKQGKYREALDTFLEINSSCLGNYEESIIHHYSALCYAYLGKFRRSEQEFDLAIRFRPHYGKIFLDKGLTHYFIYKKNKLYEWMLRRLGRRNDIEKAIKIFQDGLLAEESNDALWYYLGYMHELRGETDKARESFRKSMLLHPKIKNHEKSRIFEEVRSSK